MPTAVSKATKTVEKAAAPTVQGLEHLLKNEDALRDAGQATIRAQQETLQHKAAQVASSAAPAAHVAGSVVAGAPVVDHALGAVASVGNFSQKVSSIAWMGPTIGNILPENTDPMIKMSAGMLPIAPVAGVAIGGINVTGKIAANTVGAVGHIPGLNFLRDAGSAIAEGTQAFTHPLKEGVGALIETPVNMLRQGKLSEVLHIPSNAANHLLERMGGATPAVESIAPSISEGMSHNEMIQSLKRTITLGAEAVGHGSTATMLHPEVALEGAAAEIAKRGLGDRIKGGLQQAGQSLRFVENAVGETSETVGHVLIGERATEKMIEYANTETILGATLKAGAVASSTHLALETGRGFMDAYEKLKQFYADVKDIPVADVKAKDLMFDKDVPPCYEEARKAVLGNMPAAAALTVISAITSWEAAILSADQIQHSGNSKYSGAMAIAMQMGIPLLAHVGMMMTAPKNNVMELNYIANEVYAEQGAMPETVISSLIKQASPSFRDNKQELMLEITAAHYSDQALTPKALMQEITSGKAAATGYLLCEARHQKMASYGLTEIDTAITLAPVYLPAMNGEKQVAGYVPQPLVYDYAIVNAARNAGDEAKLTGAVDAYLAKTQPLFAEDAEQRTQVAARISDTLLQHPDISTLSFIKFGGIEEIMGAMPHPRSNPLPAVTGIELHGKAHAGMETAMGGVV